MNRRDLQKITHIRLSESKALLDRRLYSGSYYLCGYAIECGLKACLAKQTKRHDFPNKKLANDCYTHNLNTVVGVAGLQAALSAEMVRDPAFSVNWAIVKDWNPESRYSIQTAALAKGLYKAATDSRHGVMRWLELHW